MATTKERTILHFRGRLASRVQGFEGISPPPLKKCVGELSNLRHAGLALAEYSKGNSIFYLADVKVDYPVNDWATILINHSDKHEPDPAFSVPNKAHRIERKKQHEGIDSSCHVLMCLKDNGTPDTYRMFIEHRTKMPSPRIEAVLNKLLKIAEHRDHTIFQIPHPSGAADRSGKPKVIRRLPFFELLGEPSAEFIHDVENGALSGIDVVKDASATPFDQQGYLVSEREVLRLIPGKQGGGFRQVLDAVCDAARKRAFSKATIRFKSNNISRSVTVDTLTGGLGFDAEYVRKSQISGFSGLLESSYQSICHSIADKMQQLS